MEASYNYSAVVTNSGEVYTWGSGEFGRLGSVSAKKQATPMLVKELSTEKITKISLGFYHAAALNEQFQMFTWGRGINGQLGHGEIYNELSVKQVAQFQGT